MAKTYFSTLGRKWVAISDSDRIQCQLFSPHNIYKTLIFFHTVVSFELLLHCQVQQEPLTGHE